jgi:hypothetical protein
MRFRIATTMNYPQSEIEISDDGEIFTEKMISRLIEKTLEEEVDATSFIFTVVRVR